ncbi:MAG: long-chain fatty acid--CoA ligase [Deltaproteobacteria bacterium]|nr:MAG: long-chain fatty acid--CoA ligase [Deltaproteobacteria bacterium]
MAIEAKVIPEAFFEQVSRQKDHLALRYKNFGIWRKVSWLEHGERVKEVAFGLPSMGTKKEEAVCILGDNRREWLIFHMAVMSVGACTCGIYPTLAPEEIGYIVNHSGARLIFVENEEQLDKILAILPDLKNIEQIVLWDLKGLWGFSHPRVIFMEEFIKKGKDLRKQNSAAVDERIASLDTQDTAMITYTSGTTGRPKGALLSHANISSVTQAFLEVIPVSDRGEEVSYLPLAHIYENLVSVFMHVFTGVVVNFAESMETLAQNLKEISPTIFGSVPRIWEKFASSIEIRMDESTSVKKSLYRISLKVGKKYILAKSGSSWAPVWRALYFIFYWLVLFHLKRQMGFECIRWALCSAAAASRELFGFFNILGIPLRDGYGQTESTGIIALQRLNQEPRYGYVGEALPGLEMKIAEDGEILARGPGVFKGYHKNPELTKETLKGGWLHTGDLGAIDEGHLKIIGREKDIIITSGGKNITPEYIENKLKFSPYIQDAVVIGDGRKYLTALILIDEDNVTKYAQDMRIPFTTFQDLSQKEEIKKLIDREVREVNKTLARVETIKRFALIPRRFYAEDGDVTPTQKVKRRNLQQQYRDLIKSLYR